MDPSRGDSRYNLNYSMSSIGLSLADQADLYGGNPAAVSALGGRPPSGGLIQPMGGGGGVGFSTRTGSLMPNTSTQCQSLSSANSAGGSGQQRGIKRAGSDCYEDHHRSSSGGMTSQSLQGLESCVGGNGQQAGGQQQQQQQQQQAQVSGSVPDVVDDSYNALQNKKSPPANGKKTKGRVKIKMEYIDNKLRRYTTFSKRKTGIMKKAYELSTLTGTQVMLLVASETGHVYTFATRKLQPMITSEAGKQLIQTCLNSPDPPSVGGGDQRMSATGFEETELSYNIADEDSKDDRSPMSSGNESEDSSDVESPAEPTINGAKNTASADAALPETCAAAESAPTAGPVRAEAAPPAMASAVPKLTPYATPQPTQEKTTAAAENFIYPATALSSIPQEVLLQLIQSGHLQLHTEEDGSGHQYVAIPLSSATANSIKANNKEVLTRAAEAQPVTAKEGKPEQMTKQVQSTALAGMLIKQELE